MDVLAKPCHTNRRTMLIAPKRPDEADALAALRDMDVLDTAPEPEFDALVRAASLMCATPISLISLIDEERQWFKANVGLDGVTETARDFAFCAHTILGDELVEVPDAARDARFATNPLVVGAPEIRFYAGVPVRLRDGSSVGSLCVIDRVPRHLDATQREVLACLARAAAYALESRLELRRRAAAAALLAETVRTREESEARFRALSDSSPLGIYATDPAGACTYANARWQSIYGLSGGESLGTGWSGALHPEDRASVFGEWQRTATHNIDFDMQFRVQRRDGTVRHVRSRARSVRPEEGAIAGYVGTVEDVTEQRQMAADLAEQHERMRVTLQSIGDAVITTDAADNVVWLNPVAERMTGWTSGDAHGRPLADVFHVVDDMTRLPLPATSRRAKRQTVAPHRALLVSRDGSTFGIEETTAPICREGGETLGVVLVFRDVTAARHLSRTITHRASHDTLTGLVNRDELEARLQHVLDHSSDRPTERALLYVDLDQFKLINDTCGHAAGDLLLQQVSKVMQDAVRGGDTVARIGGDEFAVLLEDCPLHTSQRIAQKLCDRMDQYRFAHDEKRFRVGCSIGVVGVDARWSNASELLQAADSSCYAAKEAGRNRVQMWLDTDASRLARQGHVQWTSRIEQALDDDAFELFAQRIIALQAPCDGVHAEVLLRMRDHDGALIAPGAFLPAAERFHLASRLDRWVLRRAIDWLDTTTVKQIDNLCVNLSSQSVGDVEFQRWAVDALQQVGRDVCERLVLEITETAVVTRLDAAAQFVHEVRAAGARVALDEFGASASSFGYLKSMDVDFLKIDGQFIRGLLNHPLDEVAVRCFVDVATVAGVRTVAESVEDACVLERLRTLGVDFAQGSLLHQPSPIIELLEPYGAIVAAA